MKNNFKILFGLTLALNGLIASIGINDSYAADNQIKVEKKNASKPITEWPLIKSAIAKDPKMEKMIANIVASMNTAQKIGQMTQPEIKFVTPDEVRQYYIGSVLNGGGSWPQMNKYATATDWVKLSDQYYEASMKTDMSVKIPVIWGIDAIHGNSNVYGATLFPHNIGLGAARNTQLIKKMAVAVGKSVRATGINWVFAPTLAVGTNARWGRAYESFSEDGQLVKEYGAAYVTGLQGSFKNDGNVVGTAKHFIGDGGTHNGVDRGENQSTLSEMMNNHAQGYYGAFAAGAQTVMASYNSWNDIAAKHPYGKMHGNKELLTTVLKEKMGFDGFVVSDWDGIAEVAGCSNDSCAQAINAGIDMVMVPDNWKSFITNTIAQVERGEISMARIDDAVTRILRVKMRANMFGKKPSENKYAGHSDALQARELARQAVRESLVLLKNNGQTLPLSRGKKILVVGKSADSLINQSGGWSLTWQGTENKESDFVHGDTILAGIQEASGSSNVTYSPTGSDVNLAKFDAVIAVIGETPYAEGFGDIAPHLSLSHSQRFPEDLAALKNVSGKGKPVITLFVNGRPTYVNDLINLSTSFVAAWLPGTEGKGVADVIFRKANGKIQFPIKGVLPFSWPKVSCLSTEITKSPEQQLFGLGYGLTYSQTKEMAILTEDHRTQCMDTNTVSILTNAPTNSYPLFVVSGTRKFTLGSDATYSQLENSVSVSSVVVDGFQGKKITWKGKGRFEASAPFAIPLPTHLIQDGALQFVVQVQSAPTSKVEMMMDCGDKCAPAMNVTELFKKITGLAPQKIKIPLTCFAEKGANFKTLKTPFSVSTDGNFEASFSNVEIVAKAGNDADAVTCASLK